VKRLPRYKLCFVCGRDNAAGLGIQFFRDGLKIFCDWVPEEKHLGYRDRVHGGVVASILDEAMGWAPTSIFKRLCYSIEISVKYRQPIPSGEEVRVEAEIDENKRRVATARGRILNGRGDVCAEASGVYIPLKPGQTEEILPHLYLEGDEREVTPEDF
jgi:uncharacterized protein (TIGR00369 family)